MLITCQISPIANVIPLIQAHAHAIFPLSGVQDLFLDSSIEVGLSEYLANLKDDLWVCVESPYVDRIYRDSYYHYYASKMGSYPKDCIRLSFFNAVITDDDFRSEKSRAYLQEHFVGYTVIRPTLRSIVGRNVLSPAAVRESAIQVCQTTFSVTVNSVKLTISGFPHSSQDVETITCAQTTLWSIMEYFSQRYADYRPALPSTITKRLESLAVERQIPATGLSIEQISFALKEFGFGPRIYHRKKYGSDFEDLLSCYVESGIPVVVAIQNQVTGHALLCIGHETVEKETLAKLINSQDIQTQTGTVRLMDLDQLPKNFVFIDDNLPPYAQATLSHPATNYSDAAWAGCEITAFVVPLYKKVYLEAYQAKRYLKSLFLTGLLSVPANREVVLRFFLTSSRSYKNRVATDPIMQDVLKETILSTALPKFIWVGELTSEALFQQNQADGVVMIDATEADTINHKALILAAFTERIVNFATPFANQQVLNVPIQPFSMYLNNLA